MSREHAAIFSIFAGTTTTGVGVASWAWQDSLDQGAPRGAAFVTRPAGSTAYGAELGLPAGTVAARPYGASGLIVATEARSSSRTTLRAQLGDLSGRFDAPQLIARDRVGVMSVRLAANARGDSALAWSESLRRVYVSVRPRGGRFGRPLVLETGRIRDVSVAVGPAGEVLVAWDARGRVRACWKARGTRRFAAVEQLRSRSTYFAGLQTAIAPGGLAWVAWPSQFHNSAGDTGEAYVQLARRPAGARRFDRAALLDRGSSRETPSGVSLALSPRGSAVLAWTMSRGAPPLSTKVRAAKVRTSGAFRVTEVAEYPAFHELGAVVGYGDRGTAMVAWAPSDGPPALGAAALASPSWPGASWGASELVLAGREPAPVVATYAPSAASPAVLLVSRPSPIGGFVLQATTRSWLSGCLNAWREPGARLPAPTLTRRLR